jgi:hypothetical protein
MTAADRHASIESGVRGRAYDHRVTGIVERTSTVFVLDHALFVRQSRFANLGGGAMRGAVIEHMMPGRIRLRFASRRGDVPFFEGVVRVLSAHPTVNRITANPFTGSLLVEHSASQQELASFAQQVGLVIPPNTAMTSVSARARRRNIRQRAAAALPLSAPALALSVLGLYQAARGRLFGSAGEQFWHTLRVSDRSNLLLLFILLASGVAQVLRGRLLPPASSLFVYAFMLDKANNAARHDRIDRV